jgi:hypothetical protein
MLVLQVTQKNPYRVDEMQTSRSCSLILTHIRNCPIRPGSFYRDSGAGSPGATPSALYFIVTLNVICGKRDALVYRAVKKGRVVVIDILFDHTAG